MKWIVTGAAGFIGCNAAAALLARGDDVVAVDDLSRAGADRNLAWLEARGEGRLRHLRIDVRDAARVDALVAEHADADAVLHLAGQVAVTTSIRDPRADFETNAGGTYNVCEAVRLHAPDAVLLTASTNKVYGHGSTDVVLDGGRWWDATRPEGVDETMPLDFRSPYACSKGAADQYVLDYARTYGLRAVSLRQSCIYGPRQFGIEDQGWVAWLSAAALADLPFTIYGDGRQVRDVLFVDDLVELYVRCAERAGAVAGRALNVGGGRANALSLLELVALLERRLGRELRYDHAPPRVGDQRFFVADTRLARELLGWQPRVDVGAGLDRLLAWLDGSLDEILAVVGAPAPRAGALGSR
jgi:CDP-paratose 2-epimerase